jgi:hypothetical protein
MIQWWSVMTPPDGGVPDGNATAPGDLAPRFDELVGAAKWLGVALCVIALIAAFTTMAMRMNRGSMGDEGIGQVAKVCFAVVGIVAAPTIVAFFV